MLKSAPRMSDHVPMRAEAGSGEAIQTEASRDAAAEAQDADREVSCSMTSVLLRLIRSEGGEAAITELLELSQTKREVAYLENVDNWVSLNEATALLAAGVSQTGDERFARRVGEQTLRQHAGTQVATVLRSLGSTEAVLKTVAQTAARLSAVTKMDTLEAGPGHAVVRAIAREGFTRGRLHCDWASGLLSGTPILFGLPLARVEESECQTRGDKQCLYTVSWDAELAAEAADPQQRVTALEAQLVAMSERLHSAYATAGDLISTEDLDTVLRRIVERAANAVRAPSHILAVRTAPGAELQVYRHGIDRRKAELLAHATLADGAPDGDSTLSVEVASSRRRYGHLIARYPGEVAFFPQEKELLNLYAKHAAAVLDMATALQESAQRHEQVSSLLSLSHALAQAGTSLEVAERLAAAVPEVVDCDRIGVWLWDHVEQQLSSLAAWGRTHEQSAYMDGLGISPEDTPHLRQMIAVPEPQFFDTATEDPYIRDLMSRLEVVSLVVVPIVARDVFLGTLTVSVAERAERLHRDDELVQRLTGVAALAATAIQSGQLVDKLRHKASHDGLTGLLNRVGFRQQIDRTLGSVSPEDGQVGLLFVDLDDFKHVNDAYGHEAGDELIRKAASRLDAIARGTDHVARLGGDEFAVILAGVDERDQVRAAERRVRSAFLEPFELGDVAVSITASVGGGIWPEDGRTVKELVRHADAAMYEDKAKGGHSPVAV
jgi:diguanylate cyclase (GGDEF)-like protein